MIVYELSHTYYIYEGTPCYSEKTLGYYSDVDRVNEAIAFYSKLPGFCDVPNGFIIKRKEVLGAEQCTYFYRASIYAHTDDFEDYEHDDELGLFNEKASAQAAIALFCADNPLFLKNSLFEIELLAEKYTINEHFSWIEGFDVEPIPYEEESEK